MFIIENYKKIINNLLEHATNPLVLEDRTIANPTKELLNKHGYYLVETSPMPESSDKISWKPIYSFDEYRKVIVQNWEQVFVNSEKN